MKGLRRSGVFANASALFGATVVTSALGFGFWAVAARLAPPASVGAASGAISAMQLLGSLATIGLGTLLIGELAVSPTRTLPLVKTCVAVAGAAGVLLSVVTSLVLHAAGSRAVSLLEPGWSLILFSIGTGLTATALVLDQALIGLSQGGRQLVRNTVFAVSKLVALPALALVANLSAAILYAAWAGGNLLSLVWLFARSRRKSRWFIQRIEKAAIRQFGGAALAHHLMNVASHAPLLVLPIAVLAFQGAEANASFYLATLLASFAWTVPSHLSTALFALPERDMAALRSELRLSLKLAAAVSVAVLLGSIALGKPLLGLFGRTYENAYILLVVLMAATFPAAIKSFYVAVCRARGRLLRAALLTAAGSIMEIAAGAVGAHWGINQAAAALAGVMILEAIVFLPDVAEVAR
jgi:O-antigen/teichoic acid export membrane protein